MDLKVFHDNIRYLVNLEQGGWISPEEIDSNADIAQWWWYKKCLPFYGKSQTSIDPLSPFTVKQDYTTGIDGIITLPTDQNVDPCYETLPVVSVSYFDADAGKQRYKPVKLLSEDEITERLGSQILEPTVIDPCGIERIPGTIQLYPLAAIAGYVTYLRRPLKPVFVYTQEGREIIYNQGASTQFEWTETSMNNIYIKTAQLCGVNLSNELIIQYTELKNTENI
jgi:hypothetical protein